MRWSFDIESCPLCDASHRTSIKLKPPTAGVRGLVLDSGDLRDFDILAILKNETALNLDLRDFFDIVNGSGLGISFRCRRFLSLTFHFRCMGRS